MKYVQFLNALFIIHKEIMIMMAGVVQDGPGPDIELSYWNNMSM